MDIVFFMVAIVGLISGLCSMASIFDREEKGGFSCVIGIFITLLCIFILPIIGILIK